LQELIAPKRVVFCDKNWLIFGHKDQLADNISQVTGIPQTVINFPPQDRAGLTRHPSGLCVAQRYSWVSKRQTTREEDMAYCLMGLLRINMPILYGEGGENAFVRLQTEFARQNHDQSMLAWSLSRGNHSINELRTFSGVFASSPQGFAGFDAGWEITPDLSRKEAHDHTNLGLRLVLHILKLPSPLVDDYVAILELVQRKELNRQLEFLGIPLMNIPSTSANRVPELKFFRRKPYWPLVKLRYDRTKGHYEYLLAEDYVIRLHSANDADVSFRARTNLGSHQLAQFYVLDDENW